MSDLVCYSRDEWLIRWCHWRPTPLASSHSMRKESISSEYLSERNISSLDRSRNIRSTHSTYLWTLYTLCKTIRYYCPPNRLTADSNTDPFARGTENEWTLDRKERRTLPFSSQRCHSLEGRHVDIRDRVKERVDNEKSPKNINDSDWKFPRKSVDHNGTETIDSPTWPRVFSSEWIVKSRRRRRRQWRRMFIVGSTDVEKLFMFDMCGEFRSSSIFRSEFIEGVLRWILCWTYRNSSKAFSSNRVESDFSLRSRSLRILLKRFRSDEL